MYYRKLPVKMAPSFSPSLQIRQHRIILRNHPAGHEAAFVLGDDDLVGARVAHGLSVAGLAGAGDDSSLGVQGLGSNGNVEVVAVVVDDDADPSRAFDASGVKNVVAFGVALDGELSLSSSRQRLSLVSMSTKGISRG